MSLGFVLLAHGRLARATQLAAHVARSGFPVMVHLDNRTSASELRGMQDSIKGLPVLWASRRHRCEWGMWGIVAATRDAAEELLACRPDLRHVYLISGACLPLRPLRDLADHLDRHPDTDFIESAALDAGPWARGGGDADRFLYRYPLPFRYRALFDGLTAVQRRMGLIRRPPARDIRLGVQWWCLTRPTLEAILADPERPAAERFFRRSWIPDESYFQTLARRHARRLESRSLTLAAFDHRGTPRIFYDDHVDLLAGSGAFFARKAWPGADRLYARFLVPSATPRMGCGSIRRAAQAAPASGDDIGTHLASREARRLVGRPGLVMQSRRPAPGADAPRTAGPYSILWGVADLLAAPDAWLARATGCRCHGHLFAPEAAHFAGGAAVHAGGLPAAPAPRDRDPEAFLRNFVWATRGTRQVFRMGPGDRHEVLGFVAGDPNAQVSCVVGAWEVALWRRHAQEAMPREALLAHAADLRRREMDALALFRTSWVKARFRTWSLRAFVEDPAACLAPVLSEIVVEGSARKAPPPRLIALSGFATFARRLRDLGLPGTAPLPQAQETAGTRSGIPGPQAALGTALAGAPRRAAAG